MTSRTLGIAWKIVLIADLGVLAYGIMTLLDPGIFREGYRAYTGQDWSALAAMSPAAANYILLLARLTGGLNVAFAAAAIAIVATAFRRGETWSWYALLVSNSFAYLTPIVYDVVVGFIGFFERVEQVLLALVYLALVLSAKDVLTKPRGNS